jgi:hypothetical protein
MYPVVFVL